MHVWLDAVFVLAAALASGAPRPTTPRGVHVGDRDPAVRATDLTNRQARLRTRCATHTTPSSRSSAPRPRPVAPRVPAGCVAARRHSPSRVANVVLALATTSDAPAPHLTPHPPSRGLSTASLPCPPTASRRPRRPTSAPGVRWMATADRRRRSRAPDAPQQSTLLTTLLTDHSPNPSNS